MEMLEILWELPDGAWRLSLSTCWENSPWMRWIQCCGLNLQKTWGLRSRVGCEACLRGTMRRVFFLKFGAFVGSGETEVAGSPCLAAARLSGLLTVCACAPLCRPPTPCLLLTGHAEEHGQGTPRQAAPSDGADGARDPGGEAEREEKRC